MIRQRRHDHKSEAAPFKENGAATKNPKVFPTIRKALSVVPNRANGIVMVVMVV
jgi:hypothetical protein